MMLRRSKVNRQPRAQRLRDYLATGAARRVESPLREQLAETGVKPTAEARRATAVRK
jgi:hypothetical protein